MGVNLEIVGGDLKNYPSSNPEALQPNDMVITETTPNLIQAIYQAPNYRVVGNVSGVFSYTQDIVGQRLGDASSLVTGYVETATFSVPELSYVEITEYDPSMPLEQTLEWPSTLDELRSKFSGNDYFLGDVNNPDNDNVNGYGGNDRFVMTYGAEDFGDVFNGGDGEDTAILPSALENWIIEPALIWDEISQSQTSEGFTVTDQTRSSGNVLHITNVEFLEFTDIALELVGQDWVESSLPVGQPITQGPITQEPITSVSSPLSVPDGTHSVTVIADVFGTVVFLDNLTEVVEGVSHTIYHAGTAFTYADIDSFVTTVVRNGEFTDEFAAEIAESFPSQSSISYSTALALIGQANIESTLMMVAGADGNYIG